MLFVKDLKNSSIGASLPSKFFETIPYECESCGSPLMISEVLTGLSCSSERCIDKLVARSKTMLDDLGIKGLGTSKLTHYFNSISDEGESGLYLANILVRDEDFSFGGRSDGKMVRVAVDEELAKGIELWEMVKILNLKGIRESAKKLFADVDSIEEFFSDLRDAEDGAVGFLNTKLGINNDGSVSVRAVNIYNTLQLYKEELITSEGIFRSKGWIKDRDVDSYELNMVCSGSVGGNLGTKKDFYKLVATLLEGSGFSANFSGSLTKQTDFLFCEGGSNTSKASKAERYVAEGCYIRVMSAVEFVDKIKSEGTAWIGE